MKNFSPCRFIAVIIILVQHATVPVHAQQKTIDGYKGIWFTLGQFSTYGDKYSGGLGTYTSSHVPVAIYSKKANKTFFVYGGTTSQHEKHLLIMLSFFDHNTKTVPKPVIVYDKLGVDDPHDNASLSIDDAGYIWVFVSGRNTSRLGLIFKSKHPYQVDSFEEMHQGVITYPQPWYFPGKGFINLFTQYTKGRELYWSVSNNGKDWSPATKLAGMGGHYQVSNTFKQKVVTAFNYHPGGDVNKRTNIYLLQTSDMGKTWQTIDNKTMALPLTDKQSLAIVADYEKEGKLVYLNDLNFDKSGNPIVLAVVSSYFEPGPKGDPREWILLHWKNEKWNRYKVCVSTHNYDMGSLYVNGNQWQIIGPTQAGPQQYGTGGEMVYWQSENEGKTWSIKKQLTANSVRNHSYARRPVNAHKEFYSFWADGNTDTFSESKLYFSNKNGDVFELPYSMEANVVKPASISKK